jgi:hypothetical protein
MEKALLIQAASSIAGGMAAALFNRFSGLEDKRITEIAQASVRIARAIELEAQIEP